MSRRTIIYSIIVVISLCMGRAVYAQEKIYTVGVIPSPYVTQNGPESFSGPYIDIFALVAKEINISYVYKAYRDIDDLQHALLQGEIDIALPNGLIGMHDKNIVRTLPFLSSSLSIIAVEHVDQFFLSFLYIIYKSGFIGHIGIIMICVGIFGLLFAVIEEYEDVSAKKNLRKHIGNGLYWATTKLVGESCNISPRTIWGTVLSVIFRYFFAIVLTCVIGSFSSFITVQNISKLLNINLSTLHDKVIGCRVNSFGQNILENKGIQYKTYTSLEEALSDLEQSKISGYLMPSFVAYALKNTKKIPYMVVYDLQPITVFFSYMLPISSPLLYDMNNAISTLSYNDAYIAIVSHINNG